MKRVGTNQFSVVREAFDHAKSHGVWTGHTYNPYYYRWTGKKFVEIGAKSLTQKQFKRAKNGSKILKAISNHVWNTYWAEPSFNHIIYRSNGIVNVDYSFSTSDSVYRKNVTLKLSGKALRYVKVNKYGANSLAKATQGGWSKRRGGSSSKSIGVIWTKSLPNAFRA